jgi:transposase InsO family protein
VLVTPIADRNMVFRVLDEITGPTVGIPTLKAMFPDVPRVVLKEMLVRFRRWWRKKNALDGHRLTWHVPGTVWAMDYTKTPYLIDGQTQIIFTVRDLASRYHLCWVPVPDETAETLIPILQWLFTTHGTPLILKSDNGSAFIAAEVQEELGAWRVWPLFSPPRRPKYNGALERSNTTMKDLTHTAAVTAGHPLHWKSEDLARARKLANSLSRPWGVQGATPEERWKSRTHVDESLREELATQMIGAREVARHDLGLPEDVELASHQRAVDRLALSRCLQQLALLTLTPTRRIKPLPKRPSSDKRDSWFDKTAAPGKADNTGAQGSRAIMHSSARDKRETTSQNDLLRQPLALLRGDDTMHAYAAVRQRRAPAPHVSPPKRRARAILSWLRRPITLLIKLSKAARIP